MNTDEPILRAEYEARHANLETRMVRLEGNDDSLRRDFDTKFEKILTRLETNNTALTVQFTNLKDDLYRTRASNWRTACGWIITGIIGGGGFVAILQALHLIH